MPPDKTGQPIHLVVLVDIAYLFNYRSPNHVLFFLSASYPSLGHRGSLAVLAAQLFFTYALTMNTFFHTASISGESWLRIAGVGAGVFVMVEIEKWLRYGHGRGERTVLE